MFDLLVNAGIPVDHINKCFILNDNNNIIEGGLPEHLLGEKTSACDINFNTGMGEGVGLSNYQAAACKILNIIPDTTGIKEIINNDKGIVIPTEWYWYWNGANPHICKPADFVNSVKVLGDVVFNLYKDKNYYSRQIDNAFNWIQDKSIKKFRQDWNTLFTNLIK
jgi:glycosyltransferase involved in cell wall biosynthesis